MSVFLKDFVNRTIKQHAESTSKTLTTNLRLLAINKNWPLQLAMSISVYYDKDEDEFALFVPDNLKQSVEDVEFGTQDIPPNSVVRPYLDKVNRDTKTLGDTFEQDLLSGLELPD